MPVRLLHLLPTLAAALLLVPASADASHIRPGAFHETETGACTLNFVYSGKRGPYVGTAAHCVKEIGQDVRDGEGEIFGDVALIGDEEQTTSDWALIRVRRGFRAHVDPRVKGHPQYPTGVTGERQTAFGDAVQISGYGLGFGAAAITQEQRRGLLSFHDDRTIAVIAPLIFGDSGGPLVHIPTGTALGIVSRICIGLCEAEGATVGGILAQAREAGLRLRLRTAG